MVTDPLRPVANVPLYVTVRDDLQHRIQSGEYGVGDWLPSEAELQRTYGVSQTPVRRALLELEKAGVISRHQGRGSLVRSQELTAFNTMAGLSAELRNRGHQVRSVLLGEAGTVRPAPEVVDALALADGERVYHVRRLFVVDDEPCIVLEHFLASVVGPGVLDEMANGGSLYAYLSAHGLAITQARETISATTLGADIAPALDLETTAPALVRERVGLIDDWTPIESTTYWIRPDRYSIQLRLSGGTTV